MMRDLSETVARDFLASNSHDPKADPSEIVRAAIEYTLQQYAVIQHNYHERLVAEVTERRERNGELSHPFDYTDWEEILDEVGSKMRRMGFS